MIFPFLLSTFSQYKRLMLKKSTPADWFFIFIFSQFPIISLQSPIEREDITSPFPYRKRENQSAGALLSYKLKLRKWISLYGEKGERERSICWSCSKWLCSLLFFEITQYNSDTHNAHTITPLWTRVHKSYPYEHLRRLSRQILKIDEVITGVSLSTGTLPTTECITAAYNKFRLWHLHACSNILLHWFEKKNRARI